VAIWADYPSCSSAGELVDRADTVVVGVVSAAETRRVDVSLEGDPVGDPYLVSSVTVEQVVKGDLEAGDVIEVKQLLSADSPQRIWLDREGMRAVLFLAEFAGLPYSPLSPIQGVVSIEGGKTKAAPGDRPRSLMDGCVDLSRDSSGLCAQCAHMAKQRREVGDDSGSQPSGCSQGSFQPRAAVDAGRRLGAATRRPMRSV